MFVSFISKQQNSEISTHGLFRELAKIIDWVEKSLDQRPREFRFLVFILFSCFFVFVFVFVFDLVSSVCFRKRVVVMGKRKWRLWRSSSRGSKLRGKNVAASKESDSVVAAGDGFFAVVAAVARAHPKDFMVVRKEWVAIRSQTAFRGILVHGFLFSLLYYSYFSTI